MRLPSQRWLTIVFLATTVVFVGVATYLYALRFFAWAESDAAVTALLADKLLQVKRPVVDTWYYANGDVWLLAPHLLALLPVAVLGLGPASLWIAVVLGFLLELAVLTRVYLWLGGERWLALFAAMVTLMAWSLSHVAYVYIQLGYGFTTVVYLVLFAAAARLIEPAPPRGWTWLAAGGLVAVIAASNPARALVFAVAPIVAACAWPWRGLGVRRRLAVAAAVLAGWIAAYLVYAKVLARVVQFSVPRGHIAFEVADLRGIGENLVHLAQGIVLLCGGRDGALWAVPGLFVLAGAVALVLTEDLASRAVTPLRLLCIMATAQLAAVCVPMVLGNLLVSTTSVRYAMPSLLVMFGLAAILAVRALGAATRRWLRLLAAAWLGAVPVAALVAVHDAGPPTPEHYQWPDLRELRQVAGELVRRKLRHGFANVLGANVINLHSHGATLACPVYFRDYVMPQRWLADTSCYEASAFPAQIYVVVDQTEHDAVALRATMPAPIERFAVGPTYAVAVFRTADVAMQWLDLPLADGADARFPMELPATHLMLRRGEAVVDGAAVVATGKPGTVIYGPYMTLPRGRYDVTWIGRGFGEPGRLAFSARAQGGHEILDQRELYARDLPAAPGELNHLQFRLDHVRDGVEFLVESGGGGRVELQRLVIRKR